MTDDPKTAVRAGLRRWFRTPPRRHGEIDYGREVSFLELFYDLVYVVLIAQIAHHLADHVGWVGVRDFAIVFGLIWLAWFNGTLWHELHSREDGRSRSYIFLQMGLLAVLAVFAGHATDGDGPAFAITYAILFGLYTWQWYTIHRIDEPEYRPTTTRYLTGMGITIVAVVASALVDDTIRLWIWGVLLLLWFAGAIASVVRDDMASLNSGLTSSLVERFGLFTIIVLGEVVVGVVDGISEVEDLDGLTIATGIAALTIGFGFWWNYFDALGRRVPGRAGARLAGWLYAHIPVTMAIAAAGAAMVSLVEHAGDPRTPAASGWLLAGSVSVVLFGIAIAVRGLAPGEFPDVVERQFLPTFGAAAVAVLALAAVRPTPLVFVLVVSLVLGVTWFRMILLYFVHGAEPARTREGTEAD